MSKPIKCYLKMKNGDVKKYKSKDGAGFKTKKGERYDPPNEENGEVLELDHWLMGRRRKAFYKEGITHALPIHLKDVRPSEDSLTPNDKENLEGDFLVTEMRRAFYSDPKKEAMRAWLQIVISFITLILGIYCAIKLHQIWSLV